MRNKKLIIFVSAIITLTIILLLSGFVVFSLLGSNIDYEADEMLFTSSQRDSSAVYLAYDAEGDWIEYYTDTSRDYKEWYPFDEIGEYVKLGFLSAEDRAFYNHSGVNFRRTIAAFLNHFLHYSNKFGASTITQQVIKNISGDNEFTLNRKINEILRAIHIENRHSKDEIFELYLNLVPMSNNIYGIGAASEYYFGKAPKDLTLAQSALLVGITNAPSRYDPIRNSEAAKNKRNNVLYAMFDYGAISKTEYEDAKSEPIILNIKELKSNVTPWFVEMANNDIIKDLMSKYDINERSAEMMLRGCKIHLTVDMRVQKILSDYFSNVDLLSPAYNSGLNYSMIIFDNTSGDIVGVVGSAGKKEGNKLLNMATSKITPGSTLKPLALYAPMVDGGKVHSASLIKDLPLFYNETENGIIGYPKNSPDNYCGAVTISDAIAFSKNTCAAEIFNILGVDEIRRNLIENYCFDLAESDSYLSPLALGQLTNGVSIRELTHGYCAFSNDGILEQGRMYTKIFDRDGNVLIDNHIAGKKVMSDSTARIMTSLLEGVVNYGTARTIKLKNIIDVAGKTGTSGGDKDRLFIGFTPYYTAGIWTGYPDGSSSVGANKPSHLDIWDEIMTEIHEACVDLEDEKSFSRDGLVQLSFSAESGRPWCYECSENLNNLREGYFLPYFMPELYCEKHGKTEKYVPVEKSR